MKFGVVIFPGSNCDQDAIHVLRNVYGMEVVELWHKDADIKSCDFIVIPGGFSYGDYLRSGAIARFSPVMEKVIEFSQNGGYVMGICNGFQVLTEAHMLPGALLHNLSRKFICKNVYIKAETTDSLLTSQVPVGKALKIPIAHGEGRYFADEETLAKLKSNNQVLFRYCDENGNVNDSTNCNGSLENIAGICNENRNVFGMMPHPERASDEALGNTDGKFLFDSIMSVVGTLK